MIFELSVFAIKNNNSVLIVQFVGLIRKYSRLIMVFICFFFADRDQKKKKFEKISPTLFHTISAFYLSNYILLYIYYIIISFQLRMIFKRWVQIIVFLFNNQ